MLSLKFSVNERLCTNKANNAERGNAREHSKEQFFGFIVSSFL